MEPRAAADPTALLWQIRGDETLTRTVAQSDASGLIIPVNPFQRAASADSSSVVRARLDADRPPSPVGGEAVVRPPCTSCRAVVGAS